MNEEHLAKLKEGVEAWNKWRKENPNLVPDLKEADLAGADLRQADLTLANLSGADLRGADLSVTLLNGANLCEADLFDVNLNFADLSAADLRGASLFAANLREANLNFADLSKADLRGASLSQAKLTGADLGGTNLFAANLSKANLRSVNLSGANLVNADLSKADLYEANLSEANLRNTLGLHLNDNDVSGTRFTPGAKDPWSVLRRTYSGPRYALHLIFLIAFLVPYIAKALMWTGVTHTQQAMIDLQGTIQQAAETVADSTYQPLAVALETAAERLANYVPSEETGWRRFRVAQLLVGWDKNWWQVALVLVLLLYNALRGFLTFKVSLLREEEERSHYAPALSDYWWLYRTHQAVLVLLFVALISFAYHAWHWLTQEVWLPLW